MTVAKAVPPLRELVRFLSHPGEISESKAFIHQYHGSKQAWEECVDILRSSGNDAANGGKDFTALIFCAVTLKHHAYNGLRLLYPGTEPLPLQVGINAADTLTELSLLYHDRNDTVRRQLLLALCGAIINFFDIMDSDHEFMLATALLKFRQHGKLQCELLRVFPEELFNSNVCISAFKRADLVRGSVMYAPRIFGQLFERISDNSPTGAVEPMRALYSWLEMHVKLIRTFGGTHDYVPNDDNDRFYKVDLDSMGAKLPRDDTILIRNSLNAIGAIGGIFTLFDILRQSIKDFNAQLCEVTCDTLIQFYSLIQFDLAGLLFATSQRYNDSVSQSSRHWATCSKVPISRLPCLVMDSCMSAMDFFSELQVVVAPLISTGVDKGSGKTMVLTKMIADVLEVLVSIASEHVAFTMLFGETNTFKAISICAFVKDLMGYPDMRCRELCLDFHSSLMGVLFAIRDTMNEPHLSTCVLRIVQTMRSVYSDFVKQVLNCAMLDVDNYDEHFHDYRALVAAFIDEAVLITGVNMLIQIVQEHLRSILERMDWSKAELCLFLISTVAQRITPDLAEGIIMKLLKTVCTVKGFKELYEMKGKEVAMYIHKSICDCLVLTCGIVAQDPELLKNVQQLCLMDFCEDNTMYGQHCARALRSLAMCGDFSTCDVFDLMRRISAKIVQKEYPLESRLELLGGIADLLSTFNESAKVRLRRDFVEAMSVRLNKLLDTGDIENINEEVVLYLTTLFLVDFRPCVTLDVDGSRSKECVEFMRKNHESTTLRRILEMNVLWPYVNICHEALRLDKFSSPDEVENLARWLHWLLCESQFGSRTQLLVVKTILQSVKLCQQDKLLNKCMDVVDQYVSRLLSVMMQGMDTLDAGAGQNTRTVNDSTSNETGNNMDSTPGNTKDSSSVAADSEAERTRSNQMHVVTDYIVFNANRFRMEGGLSELDLFTCAVRCGVTNYVAALKLLSWPKFGKYVTFMALLLPTNDPTLNKEIMELFVSIVLWIHKTRRSTTEEETQKRKLTRNASKAILMGKHFLRCNITMAEFITSAMFNALLSRPCHVEEWLAPATCILHTLIASNRFYPLVASSIKSCMKVSQA
ncbi:hypothetical protein X943_002450 [Babesia divergens]|uniref:Uncharacterized protein n=1 Tax=Babesia divergens TaxID=32595 RepID=A0AAD9G7B6_BABDI|nr:hypothetical protein X943_002450 [Babesia divergens]